MSSDDDIFGNPENNNNNENTPKGTPSSAKRGRLESKNSIGDTTPRRKKGGKIGRYRELEEDLGESDDEEFADTFCMDALVRGVADAAIAAKHEAGFDIEVHLALNQINQLTEDLDFNINDPTLRAKGARLAETKKRHDRVLFWGFWGLGYFDIGCFGVCLGVGLVV